MTYTNDQRFQSMHSDSTDEWSLKIESPQPRDSGVYECQVSTEPKISQAFRLTVVGTVEFIFMYFFSNRTNKSTRDQTKYIFINILWEIYFLLVVFQIASWFFHFFLISMKYVLMDRGKALYILWSLWKSWKLLSIRELLCICYRLLKLFENTSKLVDWIWNIIQNNISDTIALDKVWVDERWTAVGNYVMDLLTHRLLGL